MTLKSQVVADMALFLNIDEFADMHDVDGKQVAAIVDTDVNQVRSGIESEQYDGISLARIRLYVKKSDLLKRPTHGKKLRLDGEPYLVDDCADEAGIWVITLGMNET